MIGNYCKNFRVRILNLTLKSMSKKTGVNIKTLSAFENGRSNNLNNVKFYIHICEDEKLVNDFMTGFNKLLIKKDV